MWVVAACPKTKKEKTCGTQPIYTAQDSRKGSLAQTEVLYLP